MMSDAVTLADFAPSTATVVEVAIGSGAVVLKFSYQEPGKVPGDDNKRVPVCHVALPLTTATDLAAQLLEGVVEAVPQLQADLAAFSARINDLNARQRGVE